MLRALVGRVLRGGGTPLSVAESLATLELRVNRQGKVIQAMATELGQLRAQLEETSNVAQQAKQQATSAVATAESVADGLAELEDQL